jgi:MFS family permease
MLPMFLLDQGVASADIGLWTGILGQTASIIGSVFAGLLLKRHANTIPTHVWISHIVWIRVLPVALITFLVAAYENSGAQNLDKTTLNCLIAASLAQLLLSGFLTTLTFTLMMQVSFLAARSVQATHFSLLATCEVLGKLLFQPVVSVYTDQFGYSAGFILFTGLYVVSFLIFQFCPVKYLRKKQN